jgi:metal-responsive CopG/Arc/MetJ family transcriptional regulator
MAGTAAKKKGRTRGSRARSAAKVAVSIPGALYGAVEEARRRSGKSRSAVVQQALRVWLRTELEAQLVRDYEAGYRTHPEDAGEIESALATALGLLRDDEAW